MPSAARDLNRITNVKTQVFGRDETGREHQLLINLVLRLRSVGGFRQHGANVEVMP